MSENTESTESTFLARGSAADVWKVRGDINNDGNSNFVYVSKIVRVTPEDFAGYARSRPTNTTKSLNSKISWEYFVQQCKEKVLVWIQLAHYNVVKVYGLQQNLNICVEYCPKGSLREYLREQSGGSPNKETIICDILEGIEYMHSLNPPVIHGNLNAGKIFIDAGGRTKIGEFGLTALCYHVAPLLPTVVFTGFNRWMSPELFDFQSEGAPAPTVASDMWALACTLFEIVSDKLPYPDYKHDIRVQRAILKGERPGDFAGQLEGNPGFWTLVESCWSKDPLQRPSIKRILTSYLEGNPRKAYSPLNQSANLPDVKSPEASEERDIAEKLEQVHILGQEIGRVRERAEAIMEGIKRSLAAEREAEKAHHEAVAARKREQKKLQALINETMVDNEGKDAQTTVQNLYEREPDAQKDDLERMDAQRATSELTIGFDVDPAISRRSGVLPPLQQSTGRTVPLPKHPHVASRTNTSNQGHGSQLVSIGLPNSKSPPPLLVDDVDPAIPSSVDPIISPSTLRDHLKEMTTPSTRTLMSSLLGSARQTRDSINPPDELLHSLSSSTPLSYYGRFTGIRTFPYSLSPQQGHFYRPYPSSALLQPSQEEESCLAMQDSTWATDHSLAASPSPQSSIPRSGLPPPPRQNIQTQAVRSINRSPKVASNRLMKGLTGLSSWERHHEGRLGFGRDDEETEDEYEDEGEDRGNSNWTWGTGQRIHKHTPSFLDLRARRQSQL